jgi:hypothetical protein
MKKYLIPLVAAAMAVVHPQAADGEPTNHLNGYSMKQEFGTANDGKIPGKLHLRLPDEERSFVIGTFEAEIKSPILSRIP